MICYVDDFFHICFKLKEYMDALNIIYWLKEGFGPPDRYRGANVEKVHLKDGRVVWYTNCVDYLKSSIDMLIIHLEQIRRHSRIMEMVIGHTKLASVRNQMSLKNWERNCPTGISNSLEG